MKSTALLSLLAALPLAAADEKPIVAIYDLEGAISESGRSKDSLFGLEATRPLTVFDITRSLAEAATDPKVKAVVIDADDAELGLAQIQEIHRRLQAIRAAGKDVDLHVIDAPYGHDCFLLEEARQTPMIQAFLSS